MNRWILALALALACTGCGDSGADPLTGVEDRAREAASEHARTMKDLYDRGHYLRWISASEAKPAVDPARPILPAGAAEPNGLPPGELIAFAAATIREGQDVGLTVAERRELRARKVTRWSHVSLRVSSAHDWAEGDVLVYLEPHFFDPSSGAVVEGMHGRYTPISIHGTDGASGLENDDALGLSMPAATASAVRPGDMILVRVEWSQGLPKTPWEFTYVSHHPAKAGK